MKIINELQEQIEKRFGDLFGLYKIDPDACIKMLKEHPKLTWIRGYGERTFIHYATINRLPDIPLKALEINPRLAEIQDEEGNTFLHRYDFDFLDVWKKAQEIDPKLLNMENRHGISPARMGHPSITKPDGKSDLG